MFSDLFKGKNNQLSSKRVCGFILIVISIILIFLTLFLTPIGVIHESILIVLGQLFTTSAALLGLGVAEKNDKIEEEKHD